MPFTFGKLLRAVLVLAIVGAVAYLSLAICALAPLGPPQSRAGALYCALVNFAASGCRPPPSN